MTGSMTPAVLRGMVDRFGTEVPDVAVSLGVPTGTPPEAVALYVGVSDPSATDLTSGVRGAQSWPHATASVKQEEFTVSCVIEAIDGEGDPLAALDEAFAVFDALSNLCRRSMTLGIPGVILLSFADAFAVDAGQLPQGAAVSITFTVAVTTRI